MTQNNNTPAAARALRETYLAGLDDAIAELPHGLAVELREGVAEELSGLDAAALRQHLTALGSPDSVARAALEASVTAGLAPAATVAPAGQPHPQPVTVVAPEPLPLTETRGYAIAAVIALGLGGIVVPFVGWVVGCVLVATSRLWRASEKIWAIAFPLIAIGIGWLVSLIGRMMATEATGPITLSGRYSDPSIGDNTVNPLLPTLFDSLHSTVFLGALVVAPLTAVWLLTRLRGRRSAADARRTRVRTDFAGGQ